MVQETFFVEVKPGEEKDFEEAFKQATAFMSSAKGCLGYDLQRCIEQENKYLVAIQWETVEDHMIEFKNSDAFQKMKSLIGPYYQKPPQAGHYEKVNLL